MGHLEGDFMLKEIAAVLKKTFRTEDIITRFGGDEFIVLLPMTDRAVSMEIQNRLIKNIRNINEKNPRVKIDVAIGTATTKVKEELNEVLKRADKRMYAMKTAMKAKSK